MARPEVDPAARGNEPLFQAAARGHHQIVWDILNRPGADPMAEKDDYKEALELAVQNDHHHVVDVMLDHLSIHGL